MPTFTAPALDVLACQGWSEQDINQYNRLPYFFAKYSVEIRKTWPTWSKLGGKIKWQPNQGDVMRLVRKVPSPNLRQFAYPVPLTSLPTKDTFQVQETTVDLQPLQKLFESQVFNYLPNFRDFMGDAIAPTMKDMEEKIMRYEDVFLRSQVFHQSPNVWLADGGANEVQAAPVGTDATNGKTDAWVASKLPLIGNPGNLTINTVARVVGFAENDQRIPVFSGPNTAKDDVGYSGKYVLVLSGEAYTQFTFDQYTLSNRPLDYDILNGLFKGSLFGRVTSKLEDMPIRIALAQDGTISYPAPETIEQNPAAYNYRETIPNPAYVAAQFEVAFLVGAEGFKALEVGPPPAPFAGKNEPAGFAGMQWNGEVQMTKNILVPCLNEAGVVVQDTNKYGKYIQLVSNLTLGYAPTQRRNIIPIIFKRRRGVTTE